MDKKLGIFITNGFHSRALLHTTFVDDLNKYGIKLVLISTSIKQYNYLKENYRNIEVLLLKIKIKRILLLLNSLLFEFYVYSIIKKGGISFNLKRKIYTNNLEYYLLVIKHFVLYCLKNIYLNNVFKLIFKLILKKNNSDIFNKISELNVFLFPISRDIETISLITIFSLKEIKTISYATSFDNVSTKWHPAFLSDFLICWNEKQKEQAIRLYNYAENKILITGGMQYDLFTDEKLIIPRDKFLKKYNLDNNDNYVLFATVNPTHIKNNIKYINYLSDVLKRRMPKYKIIVRLHPQVIYLKESTYFSESIEKYKNIENNFIKINVPKIKTDIIKFDLDIEDTIELINLIYHSSALVGFSSSISIDAMILNKKILNFGFSLSEEDEKIISLGYDYEHYNAIKEKIFIFKNEEKFIDFLSHESKNYNDILKEQIPNLGMSSKNTAFLISRLMNNEDF